MHTSTRANLSLLPLSVRGHVDGSPHRYRRPSLCDAQHLHGLSLWPPLAVTAQHGGVYTLPGRVC